MTSKTHCARETSWRNASTRVWGRAGLPGLGSPSPMLYYRIRRPLIPRVPFGEQRLDLQVANMTPRPSGEARLSIAGLGKGRLEVKLRMGH